MTGQSASMKLGFAAVDEDHERLLSIAAEVEA
jgi:hypothetical protein